MFYRVVTGLSTWSFPGGASGKEPSANAGNIRDLGSDPWVGKIPLEKEMATHSSFLAWRVPGTEEPSRLQRIGSHRIRHN